MIRSFKDKDTQRLFKRERVKRFESFERIAYRKLIALDLVEKLEELKVPPGNRLEALAGDRKGQWSIRINDQYRLCFKWETEGAFDVEIVNYHR